MPVKKEPDLEQEDSASVSSLKKQLEDAILEKDLYRKIIEVAERDLQINIIKSPAPSNP